MRVHVFVLLLTAVLVSGGCNSSHRDEWGANGPAAIGSGISILLTPGPAPRRVFRLDGKDPCAVIPKEVWPQYAIDRAIPEQIDPTFKSPSCFFNSSQGAFGIVLVVTEGIEAWAPGKRTAQPADVDPVDRFPAISLLRPQQGPSECAIAVDTGPGQYLLANIIVDLNDLTNVPEACIYTHQFATLAMDNLLAG